MRNVSLNLIAVLLIFSVQGCWAGQTKNEISTDGKSTESDPIDTYSIDTKSIGVLDGVWEGGGEANWNQGFSIEDGKISFQDEECRNLNFNIIKKLHGNDAERKELSKSGSMKIVKYGYTTYYLEIEVTNQCLYKKYIMLTMPDYTECSAYIDFYREKEKMFTVAPSWHANAVGRSFGKFPCN